MSNVMRIEDQERILEALNDYGLPFEGYKFTRGENGRMERLGGGGFGSVYASKGRVEEQAIKVIGFLEPPITDSAEIRKCETEVWIQAAVGKKCREIVQVRDVRVLLIQFDDDYNVLKAEPMGELESVEDDCGLFLFISMERLQSVVVPLKRRKKKLCLQLDPPTESEVLKLATDIGRALRAAHTHSEEIIHRDVKLENIFWDEKIGVYKLGDFGIARTTLSGGTMTRGPGTEGYVAPEVLRGSDYDVKADMYSYGIMLYCLLNELKLPVDQYSGNPLQPPKNGSAALQKVVLKACSYYPEDRYASMEALLQALEQVPACKEASASQEPDAKDDAFIPSLAITGENAFPEEEEEIEIPSISRVNADPEDEDETLEEDDGESDGIYDDEYGEGDDEFDDAEDEYEDYDIVPSCDSDGEPEEEDALLPQLTVSQEKVKTADQLFEERIKAFLQDSEERISPETQKDAPKAAAKYADPKPKAAAGQKGGKKPSPKRKKRRKRKNAGWWLDKVWEWLENGNDFADYYATAIGILVVLLAVWKHEWIQPDITSWQFYVALVLSGICSYAAKQANAYRWLDMRNIVLDEEIAVVIWDAITISFLLLSLNAVNAKWLLIALAVSSGLGMFAVHKHILIGAVTATVVTIARVLLAVLISIVRAVTEDFTVLPQWFQELQELLANVWELRWVRLLVCVLGAFVLFLRGEKKTRSNICWGMILLGAAMLLLADYVTIPAMLLELRLLLVGLIGLGVHTVMRWLDV